MLHIYTRTNTFKTKEHLRYMLSMLLRRSRGPIAVIESVTRGLAEIGVPYSVNTRYADIKAGDTVYVISGNQALRDILNIKKTLKNIKLLAGPTITVLPSDDENLIKDPLIDVIIAPSEWVKNLYVSTDASLASRIQILPAGIPAEVPADIIDISAARSNTPIEENTKSKILIYFKNAPEALHDSVCTTLDKHAIHHRTLTYGTFKRSDYFDALARSFAMIYLSPTESQGIALNEAWIRDIPTLVWNRGYWEYKGVRWEDAKISAPYLSDETGLFFKGEQDFAGRLEEFLLKLKDFKPREHSLLHFTDKVCAESLMRIIDSIEV